MATEQTRKDVWQELLDVARLVRYYEALSDRHRRNHFILRFLLLAAASSGIAALLDILPASVQSIASGLIALFVVWDFLADYAKKAAVLHAVSLECSTLEIEWRELWADVNKRDLDDADARHKNQRLARRVLEVTGRAGHADIKEDRKLNEKCEKDAYRVMRDRYAT